MRSVEWVKDRLRFIDQTRLPREEFYVETADYLVIAEAIRKLQIRGAPAIGVAAAFAAVLAVMDDDISTPEELHSRFHAAVGTLSHTRPTAVNLFTALGRMRNALDQVRDSMVDEIRARLLREARALQQEDIEACQRIGELGSVLIKADSSILTHCNTGALATAGDGTALSVIAAAAREKKVARVFVDETRPLLQGARLTTWELVRLGVEVVLVTDNTVGLLLQQRRVDAVIVGADRIALNGDVVNKVGTYVLAVLAERHQVPFYVAAPTSSFDFATQSGENIPIEERDPREVTHIAGIRVAAEGVRVFAPAFDMTPNRLVTAIVTEAGVLAPPYHESIAGLRRRVVQRETGTS